MTGRDGGGSGRPWYRHPWVWALIAIPASSVVVGVVMIVLAASGPTDLVRDDYYEAGLAINQDLSAANEAARRGIRAELTPRGRDSWLMVVDEPEAFRTPEQPLAVSLQHPTLARRDITVELDPTGPGRWAGVVPAFSGQRTLRARLAEPEWLLQAPVRLPGADHGGAGSRPGTVVLEASAGTGAGP